MICNKGYIYTFTTIELLVNTQMPTHQPAHNILLSTFNIDREDIKEWVILDLGAGSHFLFLDVPVTNKQLAANPIRVGFDAQRQSRSTTTAMNCTSISRPYTH